MVRVVRKKGGGEVLELRRGWMARKIMRRYRLSSCVHYSSSRFDVGWGGGGWGSCVRVRYGRGGMWRWRRGTAREVDDGKCSTCVLHADGQYFKYTV